MNVSTTYVYYQRLKEKKHQDKNTGSRIQTVNICQIWRSKNTMVISGYCLHNILIQEVTVTSTVVSAMFANEKGHAHAVGCLTRTVLGHSLSSHNYLTYSCDFAGYNKQLTGCPSVCPSTICSFLYLLITASKHSKVLPPIKYLTPFFSILNLCI